MTDAANPAASRFGCDYCDAEGSQHPHVTWLHERIRELITNAAPIASIGGAWHKHRNGEIFPDCPRCLIRIRMLEAEIALARRGPCEVS